MTSFRGQIRRRHQRLIGKFTFVYLSRRAACLKLSRSLFFWEITSHPLINEVIRLAHLFLPHDDGEFVHFRNFFPRQNIQ